MSEDASRQIVPEEVRWRYANGPTTFAYAALRSPQFFQLRMDTWYWSEWEIGGGEANIGTVDYGEGPLSLEQGVSAFLSEHVAAFGDHFAGVLRPNRLYLYLKPDLTGGESHQFSLAAPTSEAEARELLGAIDRTAAWQVDNPGTPFEAISQMSVVYDLRATVRDDQGAYQDLWLPWAGHVSYSADGYAGDYIPPTHGVVGTHQLTPLGAAGRAAWQIKLACEFVSLFRPDNAHTLDRVRGYWRTWLQTHRPSSVREDGEMTHEQLEEAQEQPEEAYFMTLAEPPDGTPPDNQDLYERNWPHLQAAVQRWEQWLGHPFQWTL